MTRYQHSATVVETPLVTKGTISGRECHGNGRTAKTRGLPHRDKGKRKKLDQIPDPNGTRFSPIKTQRTAVETTAESTGSDTPVPKIHHLPTVVDGNETDRTAASQATPNRKQRVLGNKAAN